ncbi:Ada metal-binding domain-containing protein [Streptomyces sp. A0958]|uniref:Ada metal-binding domain-containing protein n=1 Tax=Streptomyces sp. A0958 TaxID=2563101 RepID=UPI0014466277|nr:Ada metal-binding domain-containing protein [Streptomyces sp. A0958]
MSSDEIRSEAVTRRDPRADDTFRYGVLSTRTYSRPFCAARTPSRHNTVFFADARQARNAGFRPCPRRRPDKDTEGLPRRPRCVPAAACRTARLHHALTHADTVTEAIHRPGFNSTGTFYAAAQNLLGMTPTAFRHRGCGVLVRYAVVPDATGRLLVAGTPTGLCAVLFGPDRDVLVDQVRRRYAEAADVADDPGLGSRLAHAVRHDTRPCHPAVPQKSGAGRWRDGCARPPVPEPGPP